MTNAAEFHCWHARNREEARQKGELLYQLYKPFLRPGPVVDLGCGEGAFVMSLREHGFQAATGVEQNEELSRLAESFGVPVVRADILGFLRGDGRAPATYMYLDVIEHVPFDRNLELLGLLPVGSRLIIQTPTSAGR